MEIEEKGALTKYELMPKRKLYIAVYRMTGGSYHSMSNESKEELLKNIRSYYGVSNIKIYTMETVKMMEKEMPTPITIEMEAEDALCKLSDSSDMCDVDRNYLEMVIREALQSLPSPTNTERQAALDALHALRAYARSCNDNIAWHFDTIDKLTETIRAALQSPRVPVIDGLDEAIAVFETGVPDLSDYEIVGVYLADCERYEDRCHMVADAARAYAKLQKGV